MVMTPLVDLDAAQVSRGPDGMVTVDDPGSPLLLSVRVEQRRGRPQIVRLEVEARHPAARITAAALSRLPLAQVLYLAGMTLHPNEAHYRALAIGKRPGQRGWTDDHWRRVWAVYEWARSTGRPGGGVQAVADLWGVAVSPTAYRWVKKARKVVNAPVTHLSSSPDDRSCGERPASVCSSPG